MRDAVFALLIHTDHEPMSSLRRALENLSVAVYPVSKCSDAESLMFLVQPDVVFTDASLPDGCWLDIVKQVKGSKAPANVIVVGAAADARLHSDAIQQGAFDFIAPPFELAPLALVVRMAAQRAEKEFARETQRPYLPDDERVAVGLAA